MDPLANLQDIQLPEQIHNYPIALGWWILIMSIIALIIFITLKILKHKKKAKLQQQAITQLLSNEPNIENTLTILKWAALQYFPRQEIANLYGKSFQLFLTKQLPQKYKSEFEQLCANTLENRYQTSLNNDDIQNTHNAALLWLKQALPPKEFKHSSSNTTESNQINSQISNEMSNEAIEVKS